MLRLLALPLALVALYHVDSSSRPLPGPLRSNLEHGQWHSGCPVPLSDLRIVSVPYVDFDGRKQDGQIIVHRDVAGSVERVFRKLYKLKFPIRHMRLSDMYGPPARDPGGRGRHRLVLVPRLGPLTVRRRHCERSLVEPRLRVCDRHQPDREPVHRVREGARPANAALRRQVAAEEGHGDPGGRACVPLDRLGLGRRLVERHEGLHALLDQRPLAGAARYEGQRAAVGCERSSAAQSARGGAKTSSTTAPSGPVSPRAARSGGCATSRRARARAPRRRRGSAPTR